MTSWKSPSRGADRKHTAHYGNRKLITVFREVLLDLIIWSRNVVSFVEPKVPVTYSQNPATKPCLVPLKLSLHPQCISLNSALLLLSSHSRLGLRSGLFASACRLRFWNKKILLYMWIPDVSDQWATATWHGLRYIFIFCSSHLTFIII